VRPDWKPRPGWGSLAVSGASWGFSLVLVRPRGVVRSARRSLTRRKMRPFAAFSRWYRRRPPHRLLSGPPCGDLPDRPGATPSGPFGAPRSLTPPKISGTLVDGKVLTASHGTWSGHPTSFRYAWQRCNRGRKCVKVYRAARSTYVVNSTDVGHRLRVVVIASN